MGGITFNYKVWLEHKGKPLMGQGRYELLKNIHVTQSLKESASNCGLSYKTAYNYIRKIEKRLGDKVIDSRKGGVGAGGMTLLTEKGKSLLTEYENVRDKLE